MSTRGRNRASRRPRAQSPPMSESPERPRPKKRTVVENAKAIDNIELKLTHVTGLLEQLVGNAPRGTTATETQQVDHTDQPDDTQHHGYHPYTDGRSPTRSQHHSDAHWTHRPTTPGPAAHMAGSRPRPTPYAGQPTTLHQLQEDPTLQGRVAQLISATLAPNTGSGKKNLAHSHVVRGHKKEKTGLGELSLAEYNMGFIRLINSPDTDQVDAPLMIGHLEAINEDAATYEWEGIRFWSEEITTLIANGKLSWDDTVKIEMLRLKLSQDKKLGGARDTRQDATTFDTLSDVSQEVRAARPAPPCRHVNTGQCTSKTHHVVNGYRYLHICAYCIYQKCSYLPHPEKDCRSKDFRKKQPAKDQPVGFGKKLAQ